MYTVFTFVCVCRSVHSILRTAGFGCYLIFIQIQKWNILLASSGDPDQMLLSAVSGLGLHCCLGYVKKRVLGYNGSHFYVERQSMIQKSQAAQG